MKKNNKIIIFATALILVVISLFYINSLNNNKENNNVPSNTDMTETIEPEHTMQIGFGISTYVSPFDAKSVEEGKLQDGELLVNSSFAVVLLNNDNRIVYSYIDRIENRIWFSEEGKIGTKKGDAEWLSLREYDDEYLTEVLTLQEAIKGKNQDEVAKYFDSVNPGDYPNIELDNCHNSIESAFLNTKGITSVRGVGVGTVTRYELADASEESNGSIKVISNFGIVTASENDEVTSLISDQVEIDAEIDNKGKVLTSRFDTRSKLEKSNDENDKTVLSDYAIKLEKFEESLLNKKVDEVIELIQDDLYISEFDILVDDLIYALYKAANSMENWY